MAAGATIRSSVGVISPKERRDRSKTSAVRSALAIVAALGLTGCSIEARFGGPAPIVITPPPAGTKEIIEPSGAVLEEPATTPVETVITGMSQAQQLRTLTRQLAR
jgi:hypothetical protein